MCCGVKKKSIFIFYKFENMTLFLETRLCMYVCMYVYGCVSVVKIETYMQGITILVTTGESKMIGICEGLRRDFGWYP